MRFPVGGSGGRRVFALVVVLMLVGMACGSDTADTDIEPQGAASELESTFPVTLEPANGPVTIEEEPDAIVSLSPTATEMLYAIDAGDQVIAVDDQSTYPEEAPRTELSGYEPNVEAIASYDPDLVIASNDPGDLGEGLEKLSIPMLLLPAAADLGESYAQITLLGDATGHVDEASVVVDDMRSEIEAITEDVAGSGDGLTYYYELDPTYFSLTSKTFVGQVLGILGLENIADEAPKSGSGYPQLSEEFIVNASPDLILLADSICCDQNLETVSQRPGWDRMTAVEEGHVVELNDDIASRWGPRIVELLRVAADAVTEATA
jgi:iron complex transport system substrate-binding protein